MKLYQGDFNRRFSLRGRQLKMDQSDSFGDFSKSLSRERSFRFDDILKSKKRLLQKERKKESINKKEMKKVQKK